MDIKEFLEFAREPLGELISMSKNAANRVDYIQGGGGNTSVKFPNGWMAIKASGYSMGQMTENDAYAVLDATLLQKFYHSTNPKEHTDIEAVGSAETKDATLSIDGLAPLRPSVEAGFHSVLGTYVLHTHSVYANFLTCTEEGRSLTDEIFDGAPYGYAWIPYVDPGATLTFTVMDACEKAYKAQGKPTQIILMENHGIISQGEDRKEVERLHEDANKRLAEYFGRSFSDFPTPKITGENEEWKSNTPWLQQRIATGQYSPDFFMSNALYPDQLVFLWENISEVGTEENKCNLNLSTGEITYHTNQAEARIIEETLVCVLFILEAIEEKGLTVRYMTKENKGFILGWESEAYRRSLLK